MAKTKIELFEDRLIGEGLTDEKLQEFEKLLRRAGNDWSRIQHCFVTAFHFPVARLDEAVKLIEFGIDRYGNNKSGLIRSYQMLGAIYRRAGLYKKAYSIYVEIYPDIGNFHGEFPWCLLDTKMHADDFDYSPKIEEYIQLCQQESEFEKSYLDHKFMLALADYIVADHYGNNDEKGKAYATITQILQPDYTGTLYKHLQRHGYEERLRLTGECRAFLERIGTEQ